MATDQATSSTGYGPRHRRDRLCFDGDEAKYELWEVRFHGLLRTLKLYTQLAAATPDAEKNAQILSRDNTSSR